MTVTFVALGLALVSAATAPAAAHAYSMVAIIETETQGPLACGSTVAGLEGSQTLLGITDEIVAPGAAGPGEALAPLQVKPLVVIKELDRCSPPLFRALVNRERITRVEVRLFDRQGVHFFTIRLENAIVTRISRAVRAHGLHEEVAFAYQGMELIHERTGVSASHDFAG